MKAEEIRKHRDAVKNLGKLMSNSPFNPADKQKEALEYMTCWVLHEIAAQLAVMNEHLSSFATGESEPDPWGQGDYGPVKRVFHVRPVE